MTSSVAGESALIASETPTARSWNDTGAMNAGTVLRRQLAYIIAMRVLQQFGREMMCGFGEIYHAVIDFFQCHLLAHL